MYKEELIDHYRFPRNRGRLHNPTHSASLHNPLCGDSVMVDLLIQNGICTAASFEGKGCVISQATASLIIDECLMHKTVDAIRAITPAHILEKIGIELGPVRIKCALLIFDAITILVQQL